MAPASRAGADREHSADPASGLLLHFSRCNAPARAAEWSAWLDAGYRPALAELPGTRSVTCWALTQQPTPGMPSVGFSHVTIHELAGDVDASAQAIEARIEALRESDALHPNHCVTNVDVLEAHGRFRQKPLPTDELCGHILAYVMGNDPRREAEWDAWNDDVHMPDMLESRAFTGVSRWRRRPHGQSGAQYLTLYDVGSIGLEEAVKRSAAVMPGLVAAGRKHETHVGGLTVTLARAETD